MDMPQIDLVGRQIQGAAKGRAQAAAADVRAQTSIVRRAHELFAPVREAGAARRKTKAPRKNGVYTRGGEVIETVAPDGYVRKSPVQEMKVAKGYKARLVRRAILIVLGVAACAAVLYVLLDVVKFY